MTKVFFLAKKNIQKYSLTLRCRRNGCKNAWNWTQLKCKVKFQAIFQSQNSQLKSSISAIKKPIHNKIIYIKFYFTAWLYIFFYLWYMWKYRTICSGWRNRKRFDRSFKFYWAEVHYFKHFTWVLCVLEICLFARQIIIIRYHNQFSKSWSKNKGNGR